MPDLRTAIVSLAFFTLLMTGHADDIPAPVLSLARITHRMADELKRLPNYTCLQTTDRYTAAPGRRPQPFDRIRVQVAIVDGKELYSWPGAATFDDRSLARMVNNGFVSDGDFAAMAKNVFVNRTATITYAGEETKAGRVLLRYNFEISQMRSGWQIRVLNASGVVGARGFFLADAGTLDVLRFTFAAQDLPPFSPHKRLTDDVVYGRVRLGGTDVLLPLTVDLEAELFTGETHWNHTTFSSCREYGVGSSISFGDGTDAPAVAVPVPEAEVTALPSGLEIPLKLAELIDSARAAVGDEIRAVVAKNVRLGGELILPRGAVVRGVIRRFDRHVGNRPYCAVGIEFTEAEFSGRRAILFGKMEGISKFSGLHRNVIGFDTAAERPPGPGVGYFYVEGEHFVIPKDLPLTWLTQTFRTR